MWYSRLSSSYVLQGIYVVSHYPTAAVVVVVLVVVVVVVVVMVVVLVVLVVRLGAAVVRPLPQQ